MAGPITWRNVDAANPALAGAALGAAGSTINNAFDMFNRVIQQRQQVDQANMSSVDEGNKQAYLDLVSSAKTPEELAALQASGKLDTARQGLTAASRATVRGADEARLTAVRQNTIAANTFDDQLRLRAEAPLVEQAKALIIANPADPATLAFIDNSAIRDKSSLYALRNSENARRTSEIRAAELHPFAVRAAQRTDATGQLQLTEAQRAADEATQQRTFDSLLAQDAAGYLKYQKEVKDGIAVGLATFKDAKLMPRNSDGTLADNQLTDEQRLAFNRHLRDKGLPTLNMLGNDTLAAQTMREKLRQAGAKPTDLARLEPAIQAGYSSNSTAPIGREADNIARKLRDQQAEEAMSSSQYGSATNQGDRAKILEAAQQALALKIDPKERPAAYDRYNRAVTKFIDEGGIPITDSKGNVLERVLPSPEQMKLLLAKVNPGTFWATTFQSDVRDVLDAWTENNRDKQGVKDFIRFRDRRILQGVDPLGKK